MPFGTAARHWPDGGRGFVIHELGMLRDRLPKSKVGQTDGQYRLRKVDLAGAERLPINRLPTGRALPGGSAVAAC